MDSQKTSGAKVQKLSFQEGLQRLHERISGYHNNYLAMYSTWLGGIVTDPVLMSVPIDDHMVHRGDAVFEAIRTAGGRVYMLDRHLERLWTSAGHIELKMPVERLQLKEIICETVRASQAPDSVIRLYVSRGPGSFTPNPYESIGAQVYIVITAMNPKAGLERYEAGVSMMISKLAVKEGIFANVKSCNYLQNVLMKKEAVDHGFDFSVTLDENGFVAEGSTENCGIISRDDTLAIPRFRRTLRGTTALRIMELALELKKSGELKNITEADLKPEDFARAKEVFFLSTTIDILPVSKFEKVTIGDGRAGPISRKLLEMMRKDMATSSEHVTPIF